MKTKKIEIFYKGEYICTTLRSRTCKEALEKFSKSPYLPQDDHKYKPNYYNDLTSSSLEIKKLRAYFVKE